MADNTILNAGTGGDTIRDIDKGGKKTQVVAIDIGGAGAESLLTGSLPVTGTFFQATQPVSNATLPLPAGASTEATLATLNTKIPAQGQALAAASTPVVLPATQITTLTPPAAITGFNLESTQALVKAKTDNLDVLLSTRATESTLSALNTKVTAVNTGAVTISSALPAGTNTIGSIANTAFTVNGNIGITDGVTTASITTRNEQLVAYKDFAPATTNITAQDVATTSTAGANGQLLLTGTPTTGSFATIALNGHTSFAVQISGTWTGALQFERSLDGLTYTSIAAFSAGTGYSLATCTINGVFHGNASSAVNIRVRSTQAWTGTATVKLLAGMGTGTVTVGNPLRLFDKLSGVESSIKAASTLPLATDTALVVAVRDALPSGTNIIGGVTISNDQNIVTNDASALEVLNLMLIEMRVQSLILHSTLQCRDELDSLRQDATII